MRTEYEMNLCFMREHSAATLFHDEVESEVQALFADRGFWYCDYKTTEQAEMVVVEVKGKNQFLDEDGALRFLQQHGSDRFWSWLQGYHILVEQLYGGCRNCNDQ